MAAIIVLVIELAILIVLIASFWKIFTKAGQPGWAAIVPIYNIIVLLQIANKPVWWIILFFVPLLNFIIAILVSVALAQAFGKGVGFAIGLLLLGVVFYPILAFGSAQYQGGDGSPAPAPA
ncbi:MAG: DUF5684 domain-containing protein [Myxococcota bacterium]